MKKVPWTEEEVRESHDAMRDDPDFEIERARYFYALREIGLTDGPELTEAKAELNSLLILARDVEQAHTVPEWVALMNAYYPQQPAADKGDISFDARHVFLRGAIHRLLDLSGGPQSAISDFLLEWGERRAAHSDQRAEAARALWDDPELSYRKLEEVSGHDKSDAHTDVKAGALRKK